MRQFDAWAAEDVHNHTHLSHREKERDYGSSAAMMIAPPERTRKRMVFMTKKDIQVVQSQLTLNL